MQSSIFAARILRVRRSWRQVFAAISYLAIALLWMAPSVVACSGYPPSGPIALAWQDDIDPSGLPNSANGTAAFGEDDPLSALPGWLIERSIYIPYEKLRDTFERQQRGVFVPYEEFDRLWELARKATQPVKVEPPPRSGIIVAALNRAAATRERIVVTSDLTLEFLKTGWHEVPLALADAALRQATLDGAPARLVRTADGQNALLVHIEQAPTRKQLSIEYAKAISSLGGQYQVSLSIPSSAVNRWEVSVDERDVDVSVSPAAVVTKHPAPDGAASPTSAITAIIGSAREITLRWTPRAVGAERLAAIVTADSATQINLQKNLVRINQRLNLSIQRSTIGSVTLRIPEGFDVVAISSDIVKRWEKNVDNASLLQVEFFEELRGQHTLEVDLEMQLQASDSAELALANVEIVEATRQPGTLDVAADVGLGVEIASLMGLVRTHAAVDGRGERRLSFRYATVPYLLRVVATELKPLVRGTQSIDARLQTHWLTSDVIWLLDIQQAGVFAIPMEFPDGVELIQAAGFQWQDYQPAVVDQVAPAPEGSFIRIVQLNRQAMGKVGLRLAIRQPVVVGAGVEDGSATALAAHWPRLAQGFAEYVTGQLRVALPESLLVTPGQEPELRPVDAGQFHSLTGSSTNTAALVYEFTQRVPGLELTLAVRKPQILIDTFSEWSIEPGLARHIGELGCEVKYSPIQSLRLDVPQSLIGKLRVETPGWRTQRIDPQPSDVAPGCEAWSLLGNNEFIGQHQIRFTWDEPLADVAVGESIDIPLLGIVPRGADRNRGQIVVRRSELFDLHVGESARGLRPIDPTQELLGNRKVDDAVVAVEYTGDWVMSLRAARLELHELKRTNIPRALVRAVWLRQGQLSVQATYQVRGVHQRLRIAMPPGFDAETGFDQNPVRVDSQSVPIERGANDELIISLGNRDRDQTLLVELRYSIPLVGGRIMVPTFPEDCAVQKTVLCVYVPPEFAPISAWGPWTDTNSQEDQHVFQRTFRTRRQTDSEWLQWIGAESGHVAELAKFETDGRPYVFSTLQPLAGEPGALRLPLARQSVMHMAMFGFLAVIGLSLIRASWGARLAAACLVVAGLIGIMIFAPIATEVFSWSTIAWIGALIGGVWVLSSVLSFIQRWSNRASREGRTGAAIAVPSDSAAETTRPSPADPEPPAEGKRSEEN